MRKPTWMLYGATGYTGKLILKEAAKRGMRPILAGRSEEPLAKLAAAWDCEYRCFDLSSPKKIQSSLEGVHTVLHCAGPFSATSRPMVNACLAAKVNYLDITGEIDVFESILSRGSEAKKSQIVLLPGVGFDVVPSDCLALELSNRLPKASELDLAFAGNAGISPGTFKTMLEQLPQGSRVRRNGKIERIGTGSLQKKIPFTKKSAWASAIPWGDVSTAYHSTGIPNITVYSSLPRPVAKALSLAGRFAPILKRPSVKNFLAHQVDKRVKGPSEDDLRFGRVSFWGCVRDAEGTEVSGVLEVPDGYLLTAHAALASLEQVLAGKIAPGAYTPASALGARFVTTLPNTKMTIHEVRSV